MKKLAHIVILLVLMSLTVQGQGLVSLQLTSGSVVTNTLGNVSGLVDGSGAYYFELLYSSNTTLASTANQIYGNTANFALWTDSGVTGVNGSGISRGKVHALASAPASGWTDPSNLYDNLRSVLVVGWSANYGTSWAAVSAAIAAGTLADGGYFGVTTIGTSYAGGGEAALPSVNVWSANSLLGAAGIVPQSLTLNQISAVPEPGALALAAFGGLIWLASRRRK